MVDEEPRTPGSGFKLGRHGRHGIERLGFESLWQIDPDDPSRIRVSSSGSYVDLLISLTSILPEPFLVTYVLLTPAQETRQPGRYISTTLFDAKDLSNLLEEFRAFFEQDGRHHLRIRSESTLASEIVLDQHDLVFVFGDLEVFSRTLDEIGYRQGNVELPFPHTHHSYSSFDTEEDRLLRRLDWEWSPLHALDEC